MKTKINAIKIKFKKVKTKKQYVYICEIQNLTEQHIFRPTNNSFVMYRKVTFNLVQTL